MAESQKYLKMHSNSIWQGSNGYWYTRLPSEKKGAKGKLIRKKDKRDLEKQIIEYYKAQNTVPTIEQIYQSAISKSLELKNIKESSASTYNTIYNRHFTEFGTKRITSVDEAAFAEFLDKTTASHDLTRKGFNDLKCIASIIVQYAKKKKYIDYTPDDVFTEMDTNPRKLRIVMEDESKASYNDAEVQKISSYIMNNLDMRSMGILLMLITGIRIGELSALKKIDINESSITICRTEAKINRGGYCEYQVKDSPKTKAGFRTVEVPEDFKWLLEAIKNTNDDSEYCFSEDGVRLHTNSFRKKMQRICNNIGIPYRSPHKLRRTYATILIDNNVEMSIITKQMGHSNSSVTWNHYYKNRNSEADVKNVINLIPQLQERNMMVSKAN